jgi:hypothetical protein
MTSVLRDDVMRRLAAPLARTGATAYFDKTQVPSR